MKKSNSKKRILAVAGMFATLAALGFAYVGVVVVSGWVDFMLPGGGLTSLILNEQTAMLFGPACCALFTLMLIVALWTASRAKAFPILVNILILAGVGYVYADATYYYYLANMQIYAIVVAVLTLFVAIAWLLNFVALFFKNKPCNVTNEPISQQQEPTEETEVQQAEAQEQPAQENQDEPTYDAVTQRQLARLQTLLDKGVINQNQYEKLVAQFTNKN